jgi:iron(III) transport system substrate-binding protein
MTNRNFTRRRTLAAGFAVLAAGALAGAAVPAVAEDFNLDALVTAAKAEPPLTIYDSTGKIVEMAKNFAAKYGLQATGTKIKAGEQLEMIIREAQAHNVQADVFILSDPAAVAAQLLPEKFVTSWLPPDLAGKIPEIYQDPLVVVTSANVFAYNTDLFKTCPITNIWQLTEPEWKGKVAMQDPLGKTSFDDWFNQMQSHADDKVAAAYKEEFGKDLDTSSETATAQWVKALAANGPLLTDADQAASEAVGAPGQTQPFIGMISTAKFRDNADNGFKLGLCTTMKPWLGFAYGAVGVITAGTDSPNAAKLFIHYVMTEEGIAPQSADGKMSTNADVALPADEPSGIGKVLDQVFPYDITTALDDWDARQDWQDLWRVNYVK